jgi:hypothetical protein
LTQPANVATNPGADVVFRPLLSGSQPLTYTWLYNGAPMNLTAPTNQLSLASVSPSDAGTYQLLLSNAVGTAASSLATLTLLTNGALTVPQLWLLNHDSAAGDGLLFGLEAGRNYRVQTSTNAATWLDLTNFLSHDAVITFTNTILTNQPSLFYRIVSP